MYGRYNINYPRKALKILRIIKIRSISYRLYNLIDSAIILGSPKRFSSIILVVSYIFMLDLYNITLRGRFNLVMTTFTRDN